MSINNYIREDGTPRIYVAPAGYAKGGVACGLIYILRDDDSAVPFLLFPGEDLHEFIDDDLITRAIEYDFEGYAADVALPNGCEPVAMPNE